MTLQVTASAHQDTVAVQAISSGIPIRITCIKFIISKERTDLNQSSVTALCSI